jgi:hypothetical protein
MQLNASEISDLIKKQIEGFDFATEARTEGTIISVSDGIVRTRALIDKSITLSPSLITTPPTKSLSISVSILTVVLYLSDKSLMISTWPLKTLGSVATMYLLSQNANSILILVCMTYHRVCNMSNVTGITCCAKTA